MKNRKLACLGAAAAILAQISGPAALASPTGPNQAELDQSAPPPTAG
jgi:hypothetical protein